MIDDYHSDVTSPMVLYLLLFIQVTPKAADGLYTETSHTIKICVALAVLCSLIYILVECFY